MRHWTEHWMLYHAFVSIVAVLIFSTYNLYFLPQVGLLSFLILFLLKGINDRNWSFVFHAANLVSLIRLAGLFYLLFSYQNLEPWEIVGLSLFIVIADGLDGYLARRFDTVSRFGSYLDMETDAFYVMGLATILFDLNMLGIWVLGIGLIRYLYFPIVYFTKPQQQSEDRNYGAQVIAVIVMLSLPACLLLPKHIYTPLMVLVALLLFYSFAAGFLRELKSKKQGSD